jgi:hypothetical protein
MEKVKEIFGNIIEWIWAFINNKMIEINQYGDAEHTYDGWTVLTIIPLSIVTGIIIGMLIVLIVQIIYGRRY